MTETPAPLEGKLLLTAALVGALIIWLGNLGGLWWLAMAEGLVLGLLAPNWRGLAAAVGAGAVGWGLGLLWDAVENPIGSTASAITETLGMGSSAAVAILVTLLLGAILAASAAWLGRSLQRLRWT